MPRKLIGSTSLVEHEDELDYTRAALEADSDAAALLASTDDWQSMIDAARAKERAAKRAELGADAKRRVSNGALDAACERFGKELAIEADPGTPRYKTFFGNTTLSRFIKRAFEKQVSACENWIASSGDAVFERHRATLTPLVTSARAALTATTAAAVPMGQWQLGRATLGEDVTRERDGLWNELDALGRRQSKPRGWADLFFRTGPSGSEPKEDPETPAPTT